MKVVLASVGALFLGLAIGWYVEHRQAERRIVEVVGQTLQTIETSDRVAATRAVRAIEMIGTGETQQAVQLLSTPIAHYYLSYADPVRKDEQSTKLRAMIEQLAATNPVVAERIAEFFSNDPVKTP